MPRTTKVKPPNPLVVVPGVGSETPENALVITYSELDCFRQCPLKHHWYYTLLYSKEPKPGSPLSRGSLWHEVLETYYHEICINGNTARTAADIAAMNHLVDRETGEMDEDQELILWMLGGYRECYEADKHWEVLAIEFAGKVYLGDTEDGRPVYLQFKIDLVIRDLDTDQIWIVDHKSAADFSRQVEIDIDDQFGLYTWALRSAGIPVMGFIRSDARTRRNKSPMTLEQRFRRVDTYRSEQECDNIRRDALATASAIASGLFLYSAPAPDRCSWRCDFLQAHLTLRKVATGPERVLRDFGFEPRKLRHREYASNYPQSIVT